MSDICEGPSALRKGNDSDIDPKSKAKEKSN